MRILLIMRIFAELIDILIYLAILVTSFLFILPIFSQYLNNSTIIAIIILILTILINFILQYPFLKVNQTIGKSFFSLKIVSTNDARPLNIPMIIQRDIFGKIITCYFICIPMLFGKEGGHEIASETRVVRKIKTK